MKVMMFAHNGSYNRGCEAIVRSTASLIKDCIKDSEIFLSSGNPESDKDIPGLEGIYDGAESKLIKYSSHWYISSLQVKLLKKESYALSKIHQKIIQHIKDMDFYLSVGGDNYCYGEQPGLYEIDRRVKKEGKKLVLWGCSIGEEDLSAEKLKDLQLFDLILARESITYNTLIKNGLKNVKLCADPAFTMEKEELPLPAGWKEGETAGLNFSPLILKKNKEAAAAIKELIKHILASTKLTIALIPHVIQEGNNDYDILTEFYEEFKHTGRLILLPDNLNALQYKGFIARMKYFIGTRTHATIAAYSSIVPTMVLGYSVKSRGIAKDLFGEEKLVLNVAELSDEIKLKLFFDEMIKDENAIKLQLQQSIPDIKKMSFKAVDYLKEIN